MKATPILNPRRTRPSAPLDRHEQKFFHWLLAQASLDARHYRHAPLHRRVRSLLRAVRAATLSEAREKIEREPALVDAALDALLIGTTEFFRDPASFESLRRALRTLLDGRDHLRGWSAGCSDGAELYSVAMLLSDAGRLSKSNLLGTDVRARALQAAREGTFQPHAMEELPAKLREKYFQRHGACWRVIERIRAATRWETGDIFSCNTKPAWDLILCRNVAIYLEPDAATRLWSRLDSALRDGGILFVGKAERAICSGLERIGPCLYRKTKELK